MMGVETEKKLATVFKKYADHEQRVEDQRITLAKIYCLEPRTTFKRLDRNQNYCITAQDIQLFMRENSFFVTKMEASTLIAAYDADKDGCLDYKEFEKLILPATKNSLKMRTYERLQQEVDSTVKLHYEIEYQLSKLINLEITGLRDINFERQLVKARHDFQRYASFTLIDAYELNCLLRKDLRIFFDKNGIKATQLDSDNLLRRIDMDQDGIITYLEYCDFLEQDVIPNYKPQQDLQTSPNVEQQPQVHQNQLQRSNRSSSPANQFQNALLNKEQRIHAATTQQQQQLQNANSIISSPRTTLNNNASSSNFTSPTAYQQQSSTSTTVKLSKMNTTPLRKNQSSEKIFKSPTTPNQYQQHTQRYENYSPSPINETKISKLSPPKALQARKLDLGSGSYTSRGKQETQKDQWLINTQFSLKKQKSSQKLSPMKGNQEEKLVDAIKELISIELQLEKDKQQLSLKADFNLFDAFRQFDSESLGYLTIKDLINGLETLKVNESQSDVILFFRKYDKNNECRIRFSEFADVLCPKDKIYGQLFSQRKPNYDAMTIEETLSRQTRSELAKVLRNHIKSESQSEQIRQGLTENPQFSISEAFQAIDLNQNGYLTKQEFSTLLENYDFIATEKELDLVFDRYDKDRDGRVTYSEFFYEIAPKEIR